MRPIFKTPGKSAVDAVAGLVGSYLLGLSITNNSPDARDSNEADSIELAFQRHRF